VGKSNLAVNLAVAWSQMGLRVCLLDADLGLANADVLCNLYPARTLEHVVAGRCRLAEVALPAPGGFRLLPGASGVRGLADLGPVARERLLRELATLERVVDALIIDTGAGIGRNVLGFAAAAHTTLVVTTPEPTALTDGYGLMKTLWRCTEHSGVEVVVNMAASSSEAAEIHRRVSRVSRTFLGRSPAFAGAIPADPRVVAAVRRRLPLLLLDPRAPASEAIRRLGRRLAGLPVPDRPQRSFIDALASWFGVGSRPK
jgi:flagellar biosynthesis protein FlhG